MSEHALLSASGASRWLVCTPSARFEEMYDEAESTYADEGTLAHELAKLFIEFRLGWHKNPHEYARRLNEIQESEYYNEEMVNFIDEYADFVIEKYGNMKEEDPLTTIHLEQRLELTEFIPEGFGTVDVAIVSSKVTDITDLKYGKGVPVEAFENSQMKVYALGVVKEFEFLYPSVELAQMTIYQPRIENISMFEMPIKDLLHWGYNSLKPTAVRAFEGLGEYIAGEHCRFCRAKAFCKANAKYNLEIAARDFALQVATVKDEQISKILMRADGIKKWLTAVEEWAMDQAINHGKKWPGLKVVQGRSIRRYADEEAILEGLKKAGYDEDKLIKKKLPGITELSKIISKLELQKYVEPHLVRTSPKPTLVSALDKRPEFNSAAAAYLVFKDDNE